ncbi:MAG: hypothetical protein M3Y41_13900 [Pseudomonadota bacterium]|nr:hypothetical protein [Pseudomonadota bacterium]
MTRTISYASALVIALAGMPPILAAAPDTASGGSGKSSLSNGSRTGGTTIGPGTGSTIGNGGADTAATTAGSGSNGGQPIGNGSSHVLAPGKGGGGKPGR